MVTAKISDLSGGIFILFPKETAEPIMNGYTAEDFKKFKEESN